MTRYFVALLPPPTIQVAINQVKHRFASRYQSRKALNAPPHITLQPPFDWPRSPAALSHGQREREATLSDVIQGLQELAAVRPAVEVQLDGFAAFAPRVIYINVLKTPELVALQAAVTQYCAQEWGLVDPRAQGRPFRPHITVAFRDLTQANFRAGWSEFKDQPFAATFMVTDLTLLVHNDRHWEHCQTVPLLGT